MNRPQIPHAQIVIKNLTLDTTPETLSEYLWLTLGLNCPPEHIHVAPPGAFSLLAFVHLSDDCLAEFLRRYLEGQSMNGNTLVVETKKPVEGGRHHPAMPKINRPKVLEQK